MMEFGKGIIAGPSLSGGNALVVGMVAVGLSPRLRKRAILFGMVFAGASMSRPDRGRTWGGSKGMT